MPTLEIMSFRRKPVLETAVNVSASALIIGPNGALGRSYDNFTQSVVAEVTPTTAACLTAAAAVPTATAKISTPVQQTPFSLREHITSNREAQQFMFDTDFQTLSVSKNKTQRPLSYPSGVCTSVRESQPRRQHLDVTSRNNKNATQYCSCEHPVVAAATRENHSSHDRMLMDTDDECCSCEHAMLESSTCNTPSAEVARVSKPQPAAKTAATVTEKCVFREKPAVAASVRNTQSVAVARVNKPPPGVNTAANVTEKCVFREKPAVAASVRNTQSVAVARVNKPPPGVNTAANVTEKCVFREKPAVAASVSKSLRTNTAATQPVFLKPKVTYASVESTINPLITAVLRKMAVKSGRQISDVKTINLFSSFTNPLHRSVLEKQLPSDELVVFKDLLNDARKHFVSKCENAPPGGVVSVDSADMAVYNLTARAICAMHKRYIDHVG